MNSRTDIERTLDAYLASGPESVADRVIDAALLEIDHTKQRHARGGPWRNWNMTSNLRLAALVGAAAAILIGVIALRPGPLASVGGPASPSLSVSTSPAPTAVDTTTWTTFTSTRNGISFKAPTGWTVKPATARWVSQHDDPGPSGEANDQAISPSQAAFLVSSQRLPAGMNDAAWWASYLATQRGVNAAICDPQQLSSFRTMVVDGHTAYVHGGREACNFTEAIVLDGGRAYGLDAVSNLDGSAGVFEESLFEAWLSTVRLDPASAVDSPSGTPGPS
jgi:hypothetical protein